jgi:hypothetical protein
MNILKKLGLFLTTAVFFAGLSATPAEAQPGKGRWIGNNGNNRGWIRGNRNGWNKGRKRGWQNRYYRQVRSRSIYQQNPYRYTYWNAQNRSYRRGRINPREYRRQQRRRARIYRSYNRYSRDGYISNRERRQMRRQYYKYRRSVRRDRRDW